jgi:hypothetical protein
MPVKTGIQMSLKFLDSASPQPEADLPGMTTESFNGFRKQDTSHTAWKITAHL